MFTLTPETVGPYLPTLSCFIPDRNGSRNGNHFYFERNKDTLAEYNCEQGWAGDLRRNFHHYRMSINGHEYAIPDESICDHQILIDFLTRISGNAEMQAIITGTHNQTLFNPFAEFYKRKNSALSDLSRKLRMPLQSFACRETVIEINEILNHRQHNITWRVSTKLCKETRIEQGGTYVVSKTEEIGEASIFLQLDQKTQKWEFVELSIPCGFLGRITTSAPKKPDLHQLELDIPVCCQSKESFLTFAFVEHAAKHTIPRVPATKVTDIAFLRRIIQPTIIEGQQNKALILPQNVSIVHHHVSSYLYNWNVFKRRYEAQPTLLHILELEEENPDAILIVSIDPDNLKFLDMAAILYLQNLYPERFFVIKPNISSCTALTPSRISDLPLNFRGSPAELGDICYRELPDFPILVMTHSGEVLSTKQMPVLSGDAAFIDLIDRRETESMVRGNFAQKFGITKWHVLSAHTLSFARSARGTPCTTGTQELLLPEITGHNPDELLKSIPCCVTTTISDIHFFCIAHNLHKELGLNIINKFSTLSKFIINPHSQEPCRFTDLINFLEREIQNSTTLETQPNDELVQNLNSFYLHFMQACLKAARALMPTPMAVTTPQECCAAPVSDKPYQVQRMEMPREFNMYGNITKENFMEKLVFAPEQNTAIITVCPEVHIVAITGSNPVLYSIGTLPTNIPGPIGRLACRIQFSGHLELITIGKFTHLDAKAQLPEDLTSEQKYALMQAIKEHQKTCRRTHHPGYWQLSAPPSHGQQSQPSDALVDPFSHFRM